MGGYPPLGYDVKERRLVVNEKETETVRTIFSTYLKLGCVRRLKEELDGTGVVSKTRIGRDGKRAGGNPLSRGTLYNMLKNPLFVGRVSHKGQVFEGEHQAIVEKDTWERVQEALKNIRDRTSNGLRAKCPSLLAGKLFDDKGNRMSPSHSVKSGKRYRYYVSQAITQDRKHLAGSGPRLPCVEIERLVRSEIQQFIESDARIPDALGCNCCPSFVGESSHRRKAVVEKLNDDSVLLRRLVNRITVAKSNVTIEVSLSNTLDVLAIEGDANVTKGSPPVKWVVHTKLEQSGGETKLMSGIHRTKHRTRDRH